MPAGRVAPSTNQPATVNHTGVRTGISINHNSGIARRSEQHRSSKPSGLGRKVIGAQPKADRSKLDQGEVIGWGLVMAGGDTPTLLDLTEEPLHQVTRPVEMATQADGLLAVHLRGYVGPGSLWLPNVWPAPGPQVELCQLVPSSLLQCIRPIGFRPGHDGDPRAPVLINSSACLTAISVARFPGRRSTVGPSRSFLSQIWRDRLAAAVTLLAAALSQPLAQ